MSAFLTALPWIAAAFVALALLGLGIWFVRRAQEGIESRPIIDELEEELEAERAALDVATSEPLSPGALAERLRSKGYDSANASHLRDALTRSETERGSFRRDGE